MKIKTQLLIVILFLGVTIGQAQERKILSLKEAILLVTTNSNEAVLANMKVNIFKFGY